VLFELKTARFSIVFIILKNNPFDYQLFTKTSKTRVFSTNRFIFQNDARILAWF
jgi:hypothetical protein